MAVHIRFARCGMKKQPHYRVVVTDERKSRNGKSIEVIGTYDPRKKDEPLAIKKDRYEYWVKNGARATESLSKLMRAQKL